VQSAFSRRPARGIQDPAANTARDDDLGLAVTARELCDDFDAIHFRHHQVQGDDIRRALVEFAKKIPGVRA
jgi:hypothetical protein